MSRLFNGSTDVMTFAPVDWTFGTLLLVVKIVTTTDTSWQSFIEGEDSGGAIKYAMGRRNDGNTYLTPGTGIDSAVSIQDGDGWMIVAVTKATGSVAPTYHKIPIGGVRTTATGTALGNASTLGAGRVKIGGDDDPANIRLAAVAIFNGTVLTTTQLDGIASAKTTASIAALSPTWLVDDSDAFATDLIGSADRTAISGTADDADDPTSWVYGVTGGTTQVSSTRRVSYAVQAQVAATRRVNYGVRAQVAATRRVQYGVRASVAATRRVTYSVQANVTGSRRVVYVVAASGSQVTATRRVVYSVSAQVSTSRRVLYDVVGGVASTRVINYGVTASARATRRVAYSVAGNVNAPRHIIYTVGNVAILPITAHVRRHIGTRAPQVPTITVR